MMRRTIFKSRMKRLFATVVLLQVVMASNGGLTAARSSSHCHYASHKKTWYNLKLFEGDIMPEYTQILEIYGANTTAELVENKVLSSAPKEHPRLTTNTALKERDYFNLWPKRVKDVTVIPYEFSKGVFNHAEQSVITKAMQDLARQVRVVRFVPRSSVASKKKNRNYLQFTADEIHRDGVVSSDDIDCWSHVGWQGEDGTSHNNVINLGEDFCISTGPVWHLLLHTLGMWHTPSRWDRDDYVIVVWENIIPGREYNFRKRIHDDTTLLGFPYFDYGSIMNQDNDFYSKNGNDTMVAPEPCGQLNHLSAGDVMWVRLLYQCRSGPRMYDDYFVASLHGRLPMLAR